ncbi:csm3p [Saccharomyces arboricola H-6]|uniref:Chromosome segregation in meiosis protein n=1 Tax=Saccharomyces arboricola (strain H-6 / AS 2.3317 / CBS 10644) TaxID=1160507 RepID=J8PK09_SACAR|nr:csm3p [Saccharomyces arboricola H-6]
MDEDSDNLLLAFDGSSGLQNDPTIPNGLDGSAADPTIADPTAIVTKKRRPQIKLTAEKLLSDRGLPYVLKNAHKRIRISSRKDPFDNLSNIIQFYQLWAHELFPKAKFKDFMEICQTVGKTDPILREYRVSLFRDEMGMSFDIGTRETGEELETETPVGTKHIVSTDEERFRAGNSSVQDNSNEKDEGNEEDDDIYHLSTSSRNIVSDKEENDVPEINDGIAILGTQNALRVENIPPRKDLDVLLKIFKERGPSDFDENEKNLLLGWLHERRSMEKDLTIEKDVELLQMLEDWEMNDLEGASAPDNFVPREDEFDVDQDELDAMKEMGF